MLLRDGDVAAAAEAGGPLLDLAGRALVVVSNPPYIPDDARPRDPEVARHDPPQALYGGPDGLTVVRAVLDTAARLLAPGGLLVVEHGDTQGDGARAGVPDLVRDLARPRRRHGRPPGVRQTSPTGPTSPAGPASRPPGAAEVPGAMSQVFRCQEPADRARGLSAAASAVRRGDLVVLPTDTVYGVGTDAFGRVGADRLRQAKGRGSDLPLPVLVGRPRTLDGIVLDLGEVGHALVEAFWPGPLTIVARAQPTLSWDLGGTAGTVSVRMPLHPLAIELLRETGPMAVTAANRSGLEPPSSSAEAQRQLGEDVAVYLDAGPLPPGPMSTVVDVSGDRPRLLRDGGLTVELLREVAPDLVVPPA